MKKKKPYVAQFFAMILSAILIASSLSGNVSGEEIPTDTEESVVIESDQVTEEAGEKADTFTEENVSEGNTDQDGSAETPDNAEETKPSDTDHSVEAVQTSDQNSENAVEDNEKNSSGEKSEEAPSDDQEERNAATDALTEEIQKNDSNTSNTTQGNEGDIIESSPIEENVTTDAQDSTASDFTIVNGVLTEYKGAGGEVVVPNTVKVIDQRAFAENTRITGITLPGSTTIIGNEAFYCCSNLSYIKMPAVKKIGDEAFVCCYNLSNVSLPSSLSSIGYSAFYECISLESINIPNGITTISSGMFENCSNLSKVSIPNSVKEIEGFAFENCSRLKTITIPNGIEDIETGVFNNCSSLSSIIIPNSVKGIWSDAFKGCSGLKSIVLPTGMKYVWSEAFSNCSSLTSITIPASVTEMEGHIFDGSYNVVIHCPSNAAYVIKYAKEWEIPYRTYGIPAKKIILSKSAVTVGTGRSTSIKAMVSPTTATNKAVTWKSSNTKIAKVDTTGKITGVSGGIAVITATAKDGSGVKANCTVTVLLPKPGNCRFVKWNNSKYSSCNIAWNKVNGAKGYQTLLSWTNGSHATTRIVGPNVLNQNCTVAVNHVSQFKVRAYYDTKTGRKYGAWSNVSYITPSPTKLQKDIWEYVNPPQVEISWNIIYGCNGYNVFLTTNPNGTWYWNQSTYQAADETNAYITQYRGAKLKKHTRYYVRIVTRRKRNGVFCTVPMPTKSTNIGSFVIK